VTESWLLPPVWSVAKIGHCKELRLGIENAELRQLLAQAGIDAAEPKDNGRFCNAFCWKNYIIE